MLGVALALLSAALFGGMSVSIGFAVRRDPDAEAGALVTSLVGFAVCAAAALATWSWSWDAWPFLLAGLLAPGASQILFVRGVQLAGPARTSVVVGTAPLVSVTIALIFLGEPLRAELVAGAVLIVGGGLALAGEQARPESFRAIGVAFALGSTLFFATRDNVVRWLATGTSAPPQLAASATMLSGAVAMGLYLLTVRRGRFAGDLRRAAVPFALPGLLWGASYVSLFEAFYRARVTIVSPLVAAESLFGVLFAVLLLRRTELVGRHLLAGAALVVAGSALIGAFR